ncbi:flavin reductase family protein [Microbaculum marinum]|uniref:Flavin reductase family protein n=1 Tax=Microbaculum marinum TaxID=1764581 RepID=A0AAW9RSU6_9HYPH
MEFDLSELKGTDCSKLLNSTTVPRPIGWLVTMDAEGRTNAAPFSYFNVMSPNPPMVCVGISSRADDIHKDSAANILATKQFVVNFVNYENRHKMNVGGADFGPGISELEKAGLTPAPSTKIAPPRIAESPAGYECELAHTVELGNSRYIFVGRVLVVHIQDEMMLDAERLYVDTPKLDLIGRMHGGGWYARTTDLFEMPRLSKDEVEAAE